MITMLGYFSLTCLRYCGAVSPSPRGVSVQSMETMSASASMHSSTSRIVIVMRPEYPGYSRLISPITGSPVSSLMATMSRTELVRIIRAPASFAARAIRYMMESSFRYSGSPGVA